MVDGQTVIHLTDRILITAHPKDIESIIAFFGKMTEKDWTDGKLSPVSRRVLVTRREINGSTLSQLKIRTNLGVTVTRMNRNGIDLVAAPHLKLQLGDKLTVVGDKLAISHVEKMLGNQMKRLDVPNLIPIFFGIALGCLVANIPLPIPGIPHDVKLGLTGGPLIVAIIIGYFGPRHRFVIYNTISANLMLREVGICLFLASVGLGVGKDFFSTVITSQGLTWFCYGFLITTIPILIGGLIGRLSLHLNYYTLLGVLAGANTNPPASPTARGSPLPTLRPWLMPPSIPLPCSSASSPFRS